MSVGAGRKDGPSQPMWIIQPTNYFLGKIMPIRKVFLLSVLFLPLQACQTNDDSGPDSYVVVWLYDEDFQDSDFLAVIDADPASETYTEIVETIPTGMIGSTAHHTNYSYPESGRLFANGYYSGVTFVFDLTDPLDASVINSFGATPPEANYNHPHSFVALPGGNTLGAFQDDWEGKSGALVEMDLNGRVVREVSAADEIAGEVIHPYSLDILPAIDRIITGNGDIMRVGPSNHVVQVWSLSGLELLHTIRLDQGPRGVEASDPVEPRTLSDGRRAMVMTDNCGLYLIDGIDGDEPSASLVYDFGGQYCGVPVLVGDFWIQTVPMQQAVVVLDVSDPASPFEVSRVTSEDPEAWPHWISASPDGSRLLLSANGDRLILFDFDAATGQLELDQGFRDKGSDEVGVSFGTRNAWPHGDTGPAMPHGAVFWQRSGGTE